MPTFQKLDGNQARARFPFVVGPVLGAEIYELGAIVLQGRGAWAVIVDDKYEGCCPNRQYALARIGTVRADQQVRS